MGNPNWTQGHASNGGRPAGSRNRRTEEILKTLRDRGDRLAVDLLSEVANNTQYELDVRITAAISLAPYQTSKKGAVPPTRYLEEEFVYPHPNPATEGEISTNIGSLNQAYAAGTLDLDSYQSMLTGQHQHINALKAREEIPANQNIQITGGLPAPPGTNITMPELNGHAIDGVLAAPDPAPDEGIPSS
jgi:hypothetical protein